MIDVHKLSDQMIDVAERLSNMADAAEGKGRKRRGGTGHWVLLPAAGAGLYALVRSDFFSRQAKGVVEEAKTLATELPNDLMAAVRETTQKPTQQAAPSQSSGSSSGRRQRTTRGGSARTRKASSSSRKSTAGR